MQCNHLPLGDTTLGTTRKASIPKRTRKTVGPVVNHQYDADDSSTDSDASIEMHRIPLNPNAPTFTPRQTVPDSSTSIVEIKSSEEQGDLVVLDGSSEQFQTVSSGDGGESSDNSMDHDEDRQSEVEDSQSELSEPVRERPRRTVRPPLKFTYDYPGKPAYVQSLDGAFVCDTPEIFV